MNRFSVLATALTLRGDGPSDCCPVRPDSREVILLNAESEIIL
jgi:hypothetical protein